jgi:two-component system sensor histidine kinase RegB
MEQPHRLIALPWIHGLRAVGIVLFLLGFAAGVMGTEGAPPWTVGLAVLVLSGIGTAILGFRGDAPASDARVAGTLALDILALTLLLAWTDGSGSPYTLLYIFPLVLAGLSVRPAFAWSLFAIAASCYGALFVFAPANLHQHDESAMRAHLIGMWVTVILVGALTLFAFGIGFQFIHFELHLVFVQLLGAFYRNPFAQGHG